MANIKIYKSRPMHSCTISNDFKDINVAFFTFKKQVKVTSIIFAMTPFEGIYQNIYKCPFQFFELAVTVLEK